jgi:hypothetical protein
LSWLEVRDLLNQPVSEPYRADQLLKKFELSPDRWEIADPDKSDNRDRDRLDCDFPIFLLDKTNFSVNTEKGKGGLKVQSGQLQPRYRMLLWIEATDTDLDSDRDKDGRPKPHTAKSKDSFPLIIVSENELLVQIGHQEEKIAGKLDAILADMIKLQGKLDQMNNDLVVANIKPSQLDAQLSRMEDFDTGLDKGLTNTTADAVVPYRLIAEELQLNQVDPRRQGIRKKIEDSVIEPLEQLVNPDKGNFKAVADALAVLRQELAKGKAEKGDFVTAAQLKNVRNAVSKSRDEMSKLILTMNKVLSSMQGLIDIKKLIETLRLLEQSEMQEGEKIKKLKKQLEDLLFGKG